jgi:phage-related tail protein
MSIEPKKTADPERLKAIASNLAMRSGTDVAVEALYAAAAEIETLKYTVEATTKMAHRAAEWAVSSTKQMEEVRKANNELHNKAANRLYRIGVARGLVGRVETIPRLLGYSDAMQEIFDQLRDVLVP